MNLVNKDTMISRWLWESVDIIRLTRFGHNERTESQIPKHEPTGDNKKITIEINFMILNVIKQNSL
jgi:hypothetical protein